MSITDRVYNFLNYPVEDRFSPEAPIDNTAQTNTQATARTEFTFEGFTDDICFLLEYKPDALLSLTQTWKQKISSRLSDETTLKVVSAMALGGVAIMTGGVAAIPFGGLGIGALALSASASQQYNQVNKFVDAISTKTAEANTNQDIVTMTIDEAKLYFSLSDMAAEPRWLLDSMAVELSKARQDVNLSEV
jgi:hypothetical protein